MNNLFQNSIWFVVLVIIQVLFFNNINLFGYINPLFYIIFIFYYPLKKEKASLLLFSFFLGLCIDFFSDTGGINAAATLFIAYIRLPILSAILRKSEFDYQLFNIRSISFGKSIWYIIALTFIHHLIVFGLDYFSLNEFWNIISKTFITSIFTVSLILLAIILFTKRR